MVGHVFSCRQQAVASGGHFVKGLSFSEASISPQSVESDAKDGRRLPEIVSVFFCGFPIPPSNLHHFKKR